MKEDINLIKTINEILQPFAEKVGIDVNSIDVEADLLTLGVLDSMDVLRVVLDLEQKFNLKIDLEQNENEDFIISKYWFEKLVQKTI